MFIRRYSKDFEEWMMDVKAINNTSAVLQMQTQNMDREQEVAQESRKPAQEDLQSNPAKNREADFKKLDQKTQDELVRSSIEKFNKKMEMLDTQLRIEFDKDTGIKVVKIIDKNTKEVVRQLPPDVVLKIAKYIDEVTGLLFNEKV